MLFLLNGLWLPLKISFLCRGAFLLWGYNMVTKFSSNRERLQDKFHKLREYLMHRSRKHLHTFSFHTPYRPSVAKKIKPIPEFKLVKQPLKMGGSLILKFVSSRFLLPLLAALMLSKSLIYFQPPASGIQLHNSVELYGGGAQGSRPSQSNNTLASGKVLCSILKIVNKKYFGCNMRALCILFLFFSISNRYGCGCSLSLTAESRYYHQQVGNIQEAALLTPLYASHLLKSPAGVDLLY